MIWLSLVISASSAHGAEINVDGSAVLSTFDARFASVTHDIQDFIGFNIAPWDFDWAGSAPLANMLSALAPMAVRCGGTWEDGIFWERGPRTGRYPGLKPEMFAHNLTAAQWDPFARLLTDAAAQGDRSRRRPGRALAPLGRLRRAGERSVPRRYTVGLAQRGVLHRAQSRCGIPRLGL
jgi:hypothetical protein